MNAWETPLVLFTVFTQWAVGIALMLTIIEFCLPKLIEGEKIKAVKLGGILVLPLIAIGLICSVFHLGQPMGAPRALANLGNAMLSAEILAFSIVAVLALVYSLIWWKASDKVGLRKIFGALTAVGGLVAIVITSQVYALAAHPAWNNWTTPVFFLLTAVVLGAFTILFLLTRAKNEELEKGVKTFAIVGLAAIAAIVIVFGCYVGLTEKAVLANMVASPLFMVRLLVGLLVPAVCGGLALAGKANAAVVGLVCVLIGELCARILFYASTMVMYPWF